MTYNDLIATLEQAATKLGDDVPLEGKLLDMATLALGIKVQSLTKEKEESSEVPRVGHGYFFTKFPVTPKDNDNKEY